MKPALIILMQRLNGWRLWLLFSLLTVFAAEAIVSLMDLLLMGRITSDYVLTGLVAAGVVAPASLFLLSYLLQELSRQQQKILSNSVESAEARLRVALDSSDEGVLMVGNDGRVLSTNKRFLELWRVSEELAAADDDAQLLAHVLDQLVDPEGFMAGVRRLYGSDAEANDTLHFKDGRVFSRYTRALSLGNEAGRIWCFRDVSEQVRAEATLAEREELYRAIVSQAGDGIDLVDVETLRFVEVNDAACRMLGYQRKELVHRPLAMIQADLDEAALRDAVDGMRRAGHASFGARHRCKDGRILDVQLNVRVVRLRERECLVGVWRDVTESKAVADALKVREEIFSAIVNRSVEGILLIDAETMEFKEFNDAACEGLGYSRDEFSRLRLPDVQGTMNAAETLAKCRVAADTPGGLSFENRHRCKDGSLRDRHISNRPVRMRGRTYLAHVWHDVTEQNAAQTALAESRNLLQTVVDTVPLRVFWKDRDLRYLGCNPAFARDAGRSDPSELIGKDDYQMGWVEQADLYRADDRAVMESGVAKLGFEEPQTTPDGKTIWLSTSKVPLLDSAGETIGILGIYEDITTRKQLADDLRLREQYQRALLDNFPYMVWLKDEQSRFLAVNREFAKGFGWPTAESLIGRTDLDIAPRELAEAYRADDLAVLASGLPKNVEEQIEIDGRLVWFETYKSPVSIEGRVTGTVGFSRDITDRKRMERRLNLAIEASQAILWEVDFRDGHLLFDPAMLSVLGMDAGDAPDTLSKWIDCIHPDDRRPFQERVELALQPGDPLFSFEYRMADSAGTYQWVHTRGRVIERGEARQALLAVGTSMNITERKQMDAELERHRRHLEELVEQRTDALLATEARASRILESSADGLYGVDVEGRVTFINPAGCALLGYRPEDVIGRSAHDLFHHSKPDGSPFPADECAGRQAWREGRQARVEDVTYWHADGRPVPVSLAVHPMYAQGKVVGAVVSFADMSEQRAAAEARERALVAAENLARARSEFLANMSHEIRTPMNGMLGFAQIGQRNYQNPEKARNAFEKIIASGNQLLGVVNEILDFSKIDAGQLKVEATEMSLAETLERAVELVAERARGKGLELRLEKAPDFPDTCVSDPLRIGQILLNLLSNAVKFTEAGHITLFAARQDGDLVFRVSDTGIGMNDEQLGYVFNPFQQADGSTTRKFGGTGLGLAICKRLLELMHGTIRVESRLGAGSTFEFRVPYVAPGAPMHAAAASLPAVLPERPLSGLSILLAEDDEVNRLMLETNLEEDGARLVMVGDGREAVERVRRDGAAAYDVVLMDIQMPEMDGYEATRLIRELAPGLPIIGQTAHAFAEEREKCYAAGMVAHIAKPIDPQALVRLILNTVSTARHLNS